MLVVYLVQDQGVREPADVQKAILKMRILTFRRQLKSMVSATTVGVHVAAQGEQSRPILLHLLRHHFLGPK